MLSGKEVPTFWGERDASIWRVTPSKDFTPKLEAPRFETSVVAYLSHGRVLVWASRVV
jgi:hypothetical protein